MARIMFVTNSIGFGGAAKMLCFIAQSLSERGHTVVISNLKMTEDVSGYERPVSDEIELIKIQATSRLGQVREIYKYARRFKTEIIIGFTLMPNFLAKITSDLLGIPSIISERGDPYRTISNSLKSRIILSFINRSKGGVFQTDGAKEFYGERLQKRSKVIPNPVFIYDDFSEKIPEERKKTIVSVGRLDNFQKRYDVMLEAFKFLHQKYPEYTLKLYGRGTDEKRIQNWVKEWGLIDSVEFMGLTTEPMKDIFLDGMFLITSDYEGISNSLLEAMAVGLPVVSTDSTPGGARMVIVDHENGLLVPPGEPQKIAAAMQEYIEKPELARRCGIKAREVINRFAPEKIVDEWENYILNLIG